MIKPEQLKPSKKTSTELAIYALLMLAIFYGVYEASKSIEYIWRWDRVPQYLVITEPTVLTSNTSGTAIVNDSGDKVSIEPLEGGIPEIFEKFDTLLIQNGDTIFQGDDIAEIDRWRLGPLSWGLIVTLKISVIALFFSIVIGLFAGLARISNNYALRYLSFTYIEIIRGTPLLVQIFIFYFFIGTVLSLDRFTAGVAALSVFTGAYVAEIVRSGIQSIPPGQMEAARSLGMSYQRAMIEVILPQAFKRTLPPMAGQAINLIKDSSLVSIISITDLSKAGREVVSSTFAPFEVWFTVALLYLVLTGALSLMVLHLEKRLSSSD